MAGQAEGLSGQNLIRFPNGRVAASVELAAINRDTLIAGAALIDCLAINTSGVCNALTGTLRPLPSGVIERLNDIQGQLETLARMVEADALLASGAADVA